MAELVGTSRINSLLVHITNEDAEMDVDIPTHKVENGINISDHVERQPEVVKLSGFLIRPTAKRVESLVSQLKTIETKGVLVVFEGRRIYKNMLMSGFNIKADSEIMNGYKFSCTLTEVRIVKSSFVSPKTKIVTAAVAEAGRKQTENKKQSPIYHVVKKGDTYISLGSKYGVKWQQIQSWNRYDPKKLPINAKLRVG
ncbi:LysM peptidoglycan-binding domain-containing protein [Psychrobacillus psychrotolerans]|uniref:LysM peptidoglycan-binding domain-containing protein n=1 Tax=Psychrobacillus psychrotolerans TaxID=126156 RepID=UPI003B019A2D